MNSRKPAPVPHVGETIALCPGKYVRRALLVAVFCLVSSVSSYAGAEQVKLAWEPNLSTHVAGYRVYFSRENGHYTKKQMVDVGLVTSCAIDLDVGRWFITVTAYDSKGHESGYSEPVVWEKGGTDSSKGGKVNSTNPKESGERGQNQAERVPARSLIPPSAHRDVPKKDGDTSLIPPSVGRRGIIRDGSTGAE